MRGGGEGVGAAARRGRVAGAGVVGEGGRSVGLPDTL